MLVHHKHKGAAKQKVRWSALPKSGDNTVAWRQCAAILVSGVRRRQRGVALSGVRGGSSRGVGRGEMQVRGHDDDVDLVVRVVVGVVLVEIDDGGVLVHGGAPDGLGSGALLLGKAAETGA